jgi:hypothetical protein
MTLSDKSDAGKEKNIPLSILLRPYPLLPGGGVTLERRVVRK